MFKNIIAFCLSRRAIVVFGLVLFAAAGFVAYQQLNIEAYPNPTPVILEITAQAPGLSAEEMERYYTRPIEIGLYTTPGIDVIRSTSFYGLSFVRVAFKYGVDFHFAYGQAAIALQQNVSLPGGQTPTIQQNSTTGEIYRYQVVGPKRFGITNLRTVQDWIVARRLKTIPGIVQVNSWGGPTKRFDVEVDPRKLEIYNITVPQVLTALGNANLNVGGREIRVGQQSINIRGVGLIDDGGNDDLTQGYKLDDIENVVLTQQNSVPVLVKDIAKVSVGFVPRLGIWGHDHENDAVAGIVVMSRVARANDMLPQVRAEIEKMNHDGSLPVGVKIVPIYDRSDLLSVTTHTVLHNLIFGCVLVFLIQWIFLGDLRSAIIVGLNIPVALFFAIIVLVLRGESANLLSLGAVDFGIIVDSAVIFVENIFYNFQLPVAQKRNLLKNLAEDFWGSDPTKRAHSATPVEGWTDRLRLILISALQVDKAVFFSVVIIVAAFVPLFTMTGVEGAIFGPMARTYAYALTGAVVATFTVTPVLASLLLPEHLKETETIIVRGLHRIYNPVLRFALAHRALMVGIGIVFLAPAGFLISRLGSEFLPTLEEGNFWIRASMPPTLSLQDGETAAAKMRLILLKFPEVITVFSQHGRPDDGSDASPLSNVELFAPLKLPSEWPKGFTKEKLTELVNADLERELPGVSFNFSQYIQDNIEEGISGVKGENSVKIVGPNLETLTKLAEQVRSAMSRIRGITDLGIFPVLGQPNLNIRVDRAKAGRYGLNTGDINAIIQAATGGTIATSVLESDRHFDVAVRYPPEYRDTVEKIREIKVPYQTSGGANAYIPLSELATITLDTGASWIYHESNERFIPVKFSVRERDLGSTVGEAQKRIAENIRLPIGYRLVWAGEFGQLQAAKARFAVIVPITFVLILGLLYTLFNRIRESLLALSGIPFVMAGGVLGLLVSGLNFSISAAIGFISLFGVSVMIGILLINRYRRALNRGATPMEAMFRSASTLMRPLLMMSLSAGIGLLPAALSTGIGSEVQRPLATVVVGGMFVGPIMLLIVVPAFEMIFLGREKKSPARAHQST
ncbi:MAG TPA: CusA/CzcA family heavy metal efflux RND transporter [Chthoniobacterales bacterium]|jgi:cobalt-zinc-cadmium resistance protein CzcA|nr:CusA/CzcA family heavy metal efflux RND transporter [Candidatus Udaeobacter sp.]HEV3393782.1 CusA/CzcA family heavy metal efflux RND transporter [Chthoniobacterales bacterium]